MQGFGFFVVAFCFFLLLLYKLCSFPLNQYKDDTLGNENALNNKLKYKLTNAFKRNLTAYLFFLMHV